MLNKVSVSKIPDQTYKNELVDTLGVSGIIPDKLHVTYKNKPLIQSTDGGKTGDYTVSYKNNRAIGTATATITAVREAPMQALKILPTRLSGKRSAKRPLTASPTKFIPETNQTYNRTI